MNSSKTINNMSTFRKVRQLDSTPFSVYILYQNLHVHRSFYAFWIRAWTFTNISNQSDVVIRLCDYLICQHKDYRMTSASSTPPSVVVRFLHSGVPGLIHSGTQLTSLRLSHMIFLKPYPVRCPPTSLFADLTQLLPAVSLYFENLTQKCY